MTMASTHIYMIDICYCCGVILVVTVRMEASRPYKHLDD